MTTIQNWLNSFYIHVTNERLLTPNNLTTISELGYLQWSTGQLTNKASVRILYPDMEFPMDPEFGLWWSIFGKDPVDISWELTARLFVGPFRISDIENVGLFLSLAGNWTQIGNLWGLSESQYLAFMAYDAAVIADAAGNARAAC